MTVRAMAYFLSSCVLASLWLPVFADTAPATEQAFWTALLRDLVTITTTAILLLMGIIWRDYKGRLVRLEDITSKIDHKQDAMAEVIRLMAIQIPHRDERLERAINELAYGELRNH